MHRRFAVQITAALIFACSTAYGGDPKADYLGSFRWNIAKPWFGGFSGIEMSDDGRAMTVISDRTKILTARIQRQNGKITGIKAGKVYHLKSSTGARLSGRIADSEGLAIAPDGTIFVSFEGVARVARYAKPDSTPIPLHRPTQFRTMQPNGALEALAIDDNGRLYALPERGLDRNGQIPVYRWDGKRWTNPFGLTSRGRYLPVAADFGPDGKFYLLERTYSIFGFRSRLRRWDITQTATINEHTLLETSYGTHDNLEGLSIWRDRMGQLRATMIADDNFMLFQNTELVEYVLTE